MDQFPDGTYMRLQSRVRRASYLHADEDGVGVSLRPLGRERPTMDAVWRVQRVLRDGIDYVLLHGAAYGRYLALSPDEEERGGGHDRGVPAIQRGYDARDMDAITWKPVAVAGANTGGYVRLRHVYNGNLRANGRFSPWNTRVTVDQYFGTESTMRHWKVEVVPPRQGPPPALPLLTGASSPARSNVSSSRAATCDATDPKPETEIEGSTGGRSGSEVAIVSLSVDPSADKAQKSLPTSNGSAKSSVIVLENIRLQKTRQPSQLQRGVGPDSHWREPQVSGKKNEASDHRHWQNDTVPSRISSARDSKLELVGAFGGNPSAQFKKPLAVSPREPIRFHLPRRLSVLDRRGTLDATNEYATRESRLVEGSSILKWEGVNYTTTVGPGGGYGYPHPPPFYRCEVCFEKTAFYRLNCCRTVVCECCCCACESFEAGKNKRLQYQREKLPKVKLEGSDLFLWQPFSFPDDGQMLWMAKRTENRLQYYFAPIHQLMDPNVDQVKVSVYDFCQQGRDVISLSKTDQLIARNLLR